MLEVLDGVTWDTTLVEAESPGLEKLGKSQLLPDLDGILKEMALLY